MDDVAPGLLEAIREEFQRLIAADPAIQSFYKALENGDVSYHTANGLASRVGQALSQALGKYITSESLPDGRMYYNIADRVLRPLLEEDHKLIATAAAALQKRLNEKAGLGLQAQVPEVDQDRIDGIVDKISNAESFEDVSWVLGSPVENFSQHVVDDTIQANVDFQGRAGMVPKVHRRAERKCCAWCRALAGEYSYPDIPRDVYRRHENCHCVVDYDPSDGRRQNVHTKKWTDPSTRARIQSGRSVGLLSSSGRRYENDISIPKSVGAKAKDALVKLPDGKYVRLTPGSRITKVETIAGLGRNREIDVVDVLTTRYPGSKAELWQKKKGVGYVDYYGESYRANLHWYEEPSVGRVEWKVKPDADGNWFYEDE